MDGWREEEDPDCEPDNMPRLAAGEVVGSKYLRRIDLMDGQKVRGWHEVRIREVEQYLYPETCLYQVPWRNLWG